MLKIKAPIDLVCREDFLSSQDNFNERIRGNYGMIHSGITAEDLLHVVTTPPQVYIGEGGITNLVSQANVENNQIRKVEILNNFVNRVMISADGELTYQDKVYITNVLHQLGVRDEKTFMEQVYHLQEETKNTVDLINLYWSNMNDIRELVEEYRTENYETYRQEEQNIEEREQSLYQQIFNRLQTGAIYQILQNYHRNEAGVRTITNNEIQVIEQGRVAQNMLLQRLQNIARFESNPLVYRRENIYEGDQVEETEVTENTINTQINSAVLLNLVDNLFQSRYESTNHALKNWYSFEDAFYQTSGDTLLRITENTAYLNYLQQMSREEISFSDQRKQETTLLTQLLDQRRYAAPDQYTEFREEELTFRQGDEITNEEFQQYLEEHHLTQEMEGASETRIQQVMNQMLEERRMIHAPRNVTIEDIRNSETVFRQVYNSDEFRQYLEEHQLTQEIAGASETRVQQVMNQMLEEHRIIQAPVDQSYTDLRRTELTAQNLEYREGDTSIREGDTYETTELTNREGDRITEETRIRQDQTTQLMQEIDQIYQQNRVRREMLEHSVREVQRVERVPRPRDARARTMEMSQQALTDPQKYFERVKEEKEIREEHQQVVREAAMQHIPADRIETIRLLQEYMTNPQAAAENKSPIRSTDIGQLIQDVEVVQRETTRRETEEKVEEHIIDRVTERAAERIEQAAEIRNRTEEARRTENVHMVHRSVNNTISEDVLEQLQEQQNLIKETNRRIEQTVTNNETTSTRVVNHINGEVLHEEPAAKNIVEMIDRGIDSQVDSISERVYNKLERKLNNERIRRGL